MALDADFTSSGYNAYIDEAEADARIVGFEPFIDTSKWNGLTSAQKENVIVAASKSANEFEYVGVISSQIISEFNMKWPRTDAEYVNGVATPATDNPEFIKSYTAQRCIELLNYTPDNANNNVIKRNVKKTKVDVIEKEFFSDSETKTRDISLKDFESYNTIKPYVVGGSDKSYFLIRA